MNNRKGITLIALIISIIVLLLLSGITINILLGNEGIISKARTLKANNQQAIDIENIKLAIANQIIEKMTNGDINPEKLKMDLEKIYGKNNVEVDWEKKVITIKDRNGERKYKVDENGNVEPIEDDEKQGEIVIANVEESKKWIRTVPDANKKVSLAGYTGEIPSDGILTIPSKLTLLNEDGSEYIVEVEGIYGCKPGDGTVDNVIGSVGVYTDPFLITSFGWTEGKDEWDIYWEADQAVNVKKIVISEGIKTVSAYTFTGKPVVEGEEAYTNLEEIILPSTLETVECIFGDPEADGSNYVHLGKINHIEYNGTVYDSVNTFYYKFFNMTGNLESIEIDYEEYYISVSGMSWEKWVNDSIYSKDEFEVKNGYIYKKENGFKVYYEIFNQSTLESMNGAVKASEPIETSGSTETIRYYTFEPFDIGDYGSYEVPAEGITWREWVEKYSNGKFEVGDDNYIYVIGTNKVIYKQDGESEGPVYSEGAMMADNNIVTWRSYCVAEKQEEVIMREIYVSGELYSAPQGKTWEVFALEYSDGVFEVGNDAYIYETSTGYRIYQYNDEIGEYIPITVTSIISDTEEEVYYDTVRGFDLYGVDDMFWISIADVEEEITWAEYIEKYSMQEFEVKADGYVYYTVANKIVYFMNWDTERPDYDAGAIEGTAVVQVETTYMYE